GADDGSIDIDGQPGQAPRPERFDDEFVIELDQRREGRLGELLEPVARRPVAGQRSQAAESGDQWVAHQILQMLQTAGADVEQPDDQQGETRTAVIARDRRERGAQPRDDGQLPHVAADEFEPTVRREGLRGELDGQNSPYRLPQTPYLQAHQRGLLESVDDVGTSLHSMRGHAPLVHFGTVCERYEFRIRVNWSPVELIDKRKSDDRPPGARLPETSGWWRWLSRGKSFGNFPHRWRARARRADPLLEIRRAARRPDLGHESGGRGLNLHVHDPGAAWGMRGARTAKALGHGSSPPRGRTSTGSRASICRVCGRHPRCCDRRLTAVSGAFGGEACSLEPATVRRFGQVALSAFRNPLTGLLSALYPGGGGNTKR